MTRRAITRQRFGSTSYRIRSVPGCCFISLNLAPIRTTLVGFAPSHLHVSLLGWNGKETGEEYQTTPRSRESREEGGDLWGEERELSVHAGFTWPSCMQHDCFPTPLAHTSTFCKLYPPCFYISPLDTLTYAHTRIQPPRSPIMLRQTLSPSCPEKMLVPFSSTSACRWPP